MSAIGYFPIAPEPSPWGILEAGHPGWRRPDVSKVTGNCRSWLPGLSWLDLPEGQPSLPHFHKSEALRERKLLVYD